MNWSKDFCKSLTRDYEGWSKDTLRGLKLPIGMRTDGTLAPAGITLTDKRPHALLVMKDPSDFILSLICTLTKAYSPLSLHLHFFDINLRLLPSLLGYYNAQEGVFESRNIHSVVRAFTMRSILPHMDIYNDSSVSCEIRPYYELLKSRMMQAGVNITADGDTTLSSLLVNIYNKYTSTHEHTSWRDMLTDTAWYFENVVEKHNSVARQLVIVNAIDDIYMSDKDSVTSILYMMDIANQCGFHFLIVANNATDEQLEPFVKRCNVVIREKNATQFTDKEVCMHVDEEADSDWIYPSISSTEVARHLVTMDFQQKALHRASAFKTITGKQ